MLFELVLLRFGLLSLIVAIYTFLSIFGFCALRGDEPLFGRHCSTDPPTSSVPLGHVACIAFTLKEQYQ